jgi:hypothetical protein
MSESPHYARNKNLSQSSGKKDLERKKIKKVKPSISKTSKKSMMKSKSRSFGGSIPFDNPSF